jgi:hypothetical protein
LSPPLRLQNAMTTGTDLIKGALSDFLGITNYNASDAMQAFRELNDLIPIVESKYSLGIQKITSPSDSIDIPEYAVSYVKKLLGVTVSGSFGKSLTPELISAFRLAEGGVMANAKLTTSPNPLAPLGVANFDKY